MGKIIQKIKNFKWGYLLFALLFLCGGIAFLAFPEEGLKVVKMVIGIMAIVFAVIHIALTLAKKERGGSFWARIVMGGLCAICGGFVIFVRDAAIDYLLTAFGIALMIDASFKLQTAIQSKRYKSPLWWVMLTIAVSVLACGIILMKNNFDFSVTDEALVEVYVKASRLLGIALALDGLGNLLSIGYLYRVERGVKREVIEELQAEGKMPLFLDNDKATTPRAVPAAPSPLYIDGKQASEEPKTEPAIETAEPPILTPASEVEVDKQEAETLTPETAEPAEVIEVEGVSCEEEITAPETTESEATPTEEVAPTTAE